MGCSPSSLPAVLGGGKKKKKKDEQKNEIGDQGVAPAAGNNAQSPNLPVVVDTLKNPGSNKAAAITRNKRSMNVNSTGSYAQEDKIELILQGKRANVFASGISAVDQIAFKEKRIPKTPQEANLIRRALDQNFVFASLDDGEKQRLSDAMEKVTVGEGENLITQGDTGDYFYIVETGKFEVVVNGVPVSDLEEGRSFGELALMFNSPRAATIRAAVSSVVYALDRDTFRFTMANSHIQKATAISEALNKVNPAPPPPTHHHHFHYHYHYHTRTQHCRSARHHR